MTHSPDPAFLVAQDQLLGSDRPKNLAFASFPSVTEISSHTPGFLTRDPAPPSAPHTPKSFSSNSLQLL